MINSIYQLTAPRLIEVTYGEIDLSEGGALVRPSHLSICRADQRYYQGARSKEVLAKKLPMALIHECMAEVVFDTTGTFKSGDRVICIPNTPTEDDDVIAENYRRSSKFRSSGFDGFLQDVVLMAPDRLVKISDEVNPDVAAFTELISVAMHIISRFDKTAHQRRNSVGVWGDGNLGFITAILLANLYPDMKLNIFGRHFDKLA
ncbi:MAG: alcohol dehydrogenase catalytic domain-containing protein, partial [Clostridia bacterium]|nr:alcohol dehydrogenase catalytic domain-containing protein [Clostridia bacterium]